MAGLVGYASSDDESGEEVHEVQNPPQPLVRESTAPDNISSANQDLIKHADLESRSRQAPSSIKPLQKSQHEMPPTLTEPETDILIGPSLPTTGIPPADSPEDISAQPQLSPYSANRSLLYDLTLPAIPDFDIPSSPPGPPPSGTNRKFEEFLQLKSNGTHFNAKLEDSVAIRNPALMDKLFDFVNLPLEGDDGRNHGQYQTTLSLFLWDPSAFPDWSYRDQLKKARDKVSKEREIDKSSVGRNAVDFVPATSSAAGTSVPTSFPAPRGEKRKGAWK